MRHAETLLPFSMAGPGPEVEASEIHIHNLDNVQTHVIESECVSRASTEKRTVGIVDRSSSIAIGRDPEARKQAEEFCVFRGRASGSRCVFHDAGRGLAAIGRGGAMIHMVLPCLEGRAGRVTACSITGHW